MADMTLEEALAAATVDEELVTPVNEVLLINPETRTINVPDSEKLFGARQDMDVERKYFKCPRIVGDNIDLFEHRIFVNYVPSKQDGSYDAKEEVQCYWCRDLAVEGDFVTFSWKLSENVTRSAGYIAFAVYAKTIDEYGNLQTKWHTTIAIGNVLDTLPDGEELATVYPDIVMQLLERMDEVEKNGGNGTSDAVQYIEQTLTEEQQIQARTNIGAASTNEVSKLSEDIATKASAIKEKASGEVIVVTDSDEAKPLGLAIDGKSEQNQYSGKNLLPNTCDFTSYEGVNITVKEDSSIYLKGKATASNTFHLNNNIALANGDYIFSVGANMRVRVLGYNNGWVELGKEDISGSVNFKTDSSLYSNYMVQVGINVNTVYDITIYPMIRLATVTDATYEPYVGGKPSPSPELPQKIRNIGVYDEASGKYAVEVKGSGKNLFDTSLLEIDSASGITNNGDGSFTINSTNSITISSHVNLPVYLFRSGKLHLKTEHATMPYFYISFSSPKGGKEVSNRESASSSIELTEEYLASVTNVRVGFYNIDSSKTPTNVTIRPMVYQNGDDTYEPYKETTATVYLDEPLRKGDKAYWNGGSKIRVDRNRRISVLNGTENYSHSASWTNECSFSSSNVNWNPKLISGYATESSMLCDKLIVKTPSYVVANKGNVIGQGGSDGKSIFISIDGITTVEDLKSYLAENPIELEYDSAEPTIEEIDLPLNDLSMFDPTTILSNDCNANMEVTYIADTKAYVDKKITEVITAML